MTLQNGKKNHMSELSRIVTYDVFKRSFEAFLIQADKNVISKKSMGGQTPYGFSEKPVCDGAEFLTHYGRGAASKAPYINWWVVSIYYLPDSGNIVMGIEETRYPFINDIKIKPLRSMRIGNKKEDVIVFYLTTKEGIKYQDLYENFINVCEEVIRLGLGSDVVSATSKFDGYSVVKNVDKEKKIELISDEKGNQYIRKEREYYNFELYKRLSTANITGIPKIKYMEEKKHRLTIIEEYVPGISLADYCERVGVVDEELAINICLQLCAIVKQMHAQRPPLIHRDIKPSNIMVRKDSKIILIDFNAMKEFHEGNNEDTVFMGTPYFQAPEQVGFGQSDERTDIYGIGATINYIMTGGMYINQSIVPGRMGDIVRKCTQLNMSDRYQNIEELEKALKN